MDGFYSVVPPPKQPHSKHCRQQKAADGSGPFFIELRVVNKKLQDLFQHPAAGSLG